jgi:hypothetical protein
MAFTACARQPPTRTKCFLSKSLKLLAVPSLDHAMAFTATLWRGPWRLSSPLTCIGLASESSSWDGRGRNTDMEVHGRQISSIAVKFQLLQGSSACRVPPFPGQSHPQLPRARVQGGGLNDTSSSSPYQHGFLLQTRSG